jgi:hypothetical protein
MGMMVPYYRAMLDFLGFPLFPRSDESVDEWADRKEKEHQKMDSLEPMFYAGAGVFSRGVCSALFGLGFFRPHGTARSSRPLSILPYVPSPSYRPSKPMDRESPSSWSYDDEKNKRL